jgi:hypothetical protein
MKRQQVCLALVFGLIISSTIAFAETSYPLVCKGGPNMKFSLSVNGNSTTVFIRFKHASQGVGSKTVGAGWGTLKPGECAWVDRAVAPNEPEVIGHTVKQAPLFGIDWDASGSMLTGNSVLLGNAYISLQSELIKRHPYILRLLPGSATFQVFHVYNNRHGYFIVTHAE